MLQSRDDRSQFTPANSPYGAMVIDPLPTLQRNGLIAVSTLALVSLISSFGLILFITYRFLFWKKYYRRYIGHNQYVVLVYNLALADFIQGLGFIISLRWIHTNSLHASDASCFLQGIWLQLGDPMSGMFVLAIALHTFMNVSLGRQLSHRVFVTIIICLWVFGVVIVVIPIGMYGRYIWVPSVAWVRSSPPFMLFLLTFSQVLDVHRAPCSPPLDTLLLDLRRPVLHLNPLRHNVLPTPPSNQRIQNPRLLPPQQPPSSKPRSRIHGHLSHRLHRPHPPPSSRENGLSTPQHPIRGLLLRSRYPNDPFRLLRHPPLHLHQKNGPRTRSQSSIRSRRLRRRIQEVQQQWQKRQIRCE